MFDRNDLMVTTEFSAPRKIGENKSSPIFDIYVNNFFIF